MVPIKEMTDVLRVVKEQAGLRPKQWVRLKRSIYKVREPFLTTLALPPYRSIYLIE